MSHRTGDAATAFELPSKPGETVDISSSLGNKPIVLLFFPLAYSPVCTDELCSMRDGWSGWDSIGADVYGISVDSPFVTARFREDLDIPFPILSDFNRTVSRQYDVLHEDLMGLQGVSKRACFVIDASGSIVYDWVSDDPGKMPDLDAVQNALKTAAVV